MLAVTFMMLGHVASPSLRELVNDADVILVAEVTSRDAKRATARVERTLRGEPTQQITYRVDPTWRCDTSDAVVGERLLLFLDRERSGELRIAWSGRGRRPAAEKDIALVEEQLRRPSAYVVFIERDVLALTRELLAEPVTTVCHDARCIEDAQQAHRSFVAPALGVAGRSNGETLALPKTSFDSERLPASMLHCERPLDHCLVTVKPGFDWQPPATGVDLWCSFDEHGQLRCT